MAIRERTYTTRTRDRGLVAEVVSACYFSVFWGIKQRDMDTKLNATVLSNAYVCHYAYRFSGHTALVNKESVSESEFDGMNRCDISRNQHNRARYNVADT